MLVASAVITDKSGFLGNERAFTPKPHWKANTCTCSNGDPAMGTACTSDGAAICGVCDLGFHLDSGACQALPWQCDCISYGHKKLSCSRQNAERIRRNL